MTDLASAKNAALNTDELDRVVGGIIIVSGLQHQITSAFSEEYRKSTGRPARSANDPKAKSPLSVCTSVHGG